MSDVMRCNETRAEKPDQQFVDEIRIVTVPRWKESDMSGDEWRISARIDFYRKGVVVGSKGARDVAMAARFVDWYMLSGIENGEIDVPETLGNFCDQEGCCKPWTTRLRLKQRYGIDGKVIEPGKWREGVVEYRAFCDEHKCRGDCGLDDADSNYEPMDGGARMTLGPATMATAERLAAAIDEYNADGRHDKLKARALTGEFSDYSDAHDFPITELHRLCRKYVLHALAERVADGEFDASLEESNEWARSESGQSVARELSSAMRSVLGLKLNSENN